MPYCHTASVHAALDPPIRFRSSRAVVLFPGPDGPRRATSRRSKCRSRVTDQTVAAAITHFVNVIVLVMLFALSCPRSGDHLSHAKLTRPPWKCAAQEPREIGETQLLEFAGSNPCVVLYGENDEVLSAASYWNADFTPFGPGEALFLLRSSSEGDLSASVYATNAELAHFLRPFNQYFGGFESVNLDVEVEAGEFRTVRERDIVRLDCTSASGCRGSVLKRVRAGAEVSIVYLTSADASTPGLSRSEIATLREQEATAGAKLLGVSKLDFLREPDGCLTQSPSLIGKLVGQIRQRRPNLVYMPHALDDHADHMATHRLLKRALKDATGPFWPESGEESWRVDTTLSYDVWTPIQHPNYVEDITDVIDEQLMTLAQHSSQLDQVPSDSFVRGLGAYRGARLGRDH